MDMVAMSNRSYNAFSSKRQIVLGMIALLFCAIVIVSCTSSGVPMDQEHPPDKNAIKDPESGQWILKDELVIIATEQVVEDLIEAFSGEISIAIPETSTYQVKFPVSSLEELNIIKQELEAQDVQVMHVLLISP